MHAISSYRGNRPTNIQTHKQTHKQTGPTTIHCTVCTAKLSAQCNYCIVVECNIMKQFDMVAKDPVCRVIRNK